LEENKSDWSSGSATERWKQSESTGPPAALEALVQQISQPFFYGNIHLNMLECVEDIAQQLHIFKNEDSFIEGA